MLLRSRKSGREIVSPLRLGSLLILLLAVTLTAFSFLGAVDLASAQDVKVLDQRVSFNHAYTDYLVTYDSLEQLKTFDLVSFEEQKGSLDDVKVKWLWKDKPYEVVVNDYEEYPCEYYDELTGELVKSNCSEYVGNHTEIRYKDEYVDWKLYGAGKSLQKDVNSFRSDVLRGGSVVLRVEGTYKGVVEDDRYGFALDHVPRYADVTYDKMTWWFGEWVNTTTINITNPTSEDLEDFPVYVNVSKREGGQADYDDYVFVTLGYTLLPFELDSIDDSGDWAHYWLNVSVPASGVYKCRLIWNNAEAASSQDVEGTWDSNYVMVQHMSDGVDNAHITDSTAYSNDGTKLAANGPLEVAGAIGRAQEFDGTDDYIGVTDSSSLDVSSSITVEIIATPEAIPIGSFTHLLHKRSSHVTVGTYSFDYYNTKRIYFRTRKADNSGYRNSPYTSLNADTTYYIAGVFIFNTSQSLYVNNVDYGTADYSGTGGIYTNVYDLKIADVGLASEFFNGTIDEVRISNVARSASWIEAGYEFVENQSTYVTWGDEEYVFVMPEPSGYINPNEEGATWVKWTWDYELVDVYIDGVLVQEDNDVGFYIYNGLEPTTRYRIDVLDIANGTRYYWESTTDHSDSWVFLLLGIGLGLSFLGLINIFFGLPGVLVLLYGMVTVLSEREEEALLCLIMAFAWVFSIIVVLMMGRIRR